MTEPAQRRGRSKQDYRTPPAFLNGLRRKLGISDFDIDLAASCHNAVTTRYYDVEANSLVQPWRVGDGWNFCNPPYASIEPWVFKAWMECSENRAKTAMLLPAGVGSNWWKNFVHNQAHVLFINGRITFVGANQPYPKDNAVVLYEPHVYGGYECWSWRAE